MILAPLGVAQVLFAGVRHLVNHVTAERLYVFVCVECDMSRIVVALKFLIKSARRCINILQPSEQSNYYYNCR